MTSRLVALFVALLMLCAGLPAAPAHAAWAADTAAAADAGAAAGGATTAQADAPAQSCAPAGDALPPDLPVPALAFDLPAESPTDPPALPMQGAGAPDAGLAMSRPRADARPLHASPDLAGPQRPPSRGTAIA